MPAPRFTPETPSLYREFQKYGDREISAAYRVLHGSQVSGSKYDSSGWSNYQLQHPSPTVRPGFQTSRANNAMYRAEEAWRTQPGLYSPERQVPTTGITRYQPESDTIYINPNDYNGVNGATHFRPSMPAHEQYHRAQHGNPLWRAITSRDENPARRLASEFAPSLLETLVPAHGIASVMGERAVQSPPNTDAYVRKYRQAPPNTLVTPSKMTLPIANLQALAAQKGVFGPTPGAQKYGYQGNAFQPIENLLNTPEGRQWLQMFMVGNQ